MQAGAVCLGGGGGESLRRVQSCVWEWYSLQPSGHLCGALAPRLESMYSIPVTHRQASNF